MTSSGTALLLGKQYKAMQDRDSIPGISVGLIDNNVFEWEVMLMISDECRLYGGGFFRATLKFPQNYPLYPPKMRFETPIYHPNSMYSLQCPLTRGPSNEQND